MPQATGLSSEKLALIPPMLQRVVDSGDLSGFVTLIFRHGEIAQCNAIGFRNLETRAPMTQDTLFRIASMTKPVTSAAALMLMEEGKLALEDPIAKWVPEFAGIRVLKDPQGPLDDTEPAPRPITIEDLLTHRAGLSYAFSATGPIAKAYQEALGEPLPSQSHPDAWLKALAELPLLYPPGTRFHYSVATDVLGFILGRIDGRGFRSLVMERLLVPLGMSDTDFYVPPVKQARAAEVYRHDDTSGALKPLAFPQLVSPPAFCGGGGGLISTAADYLRFARMLMNKGTLDGRRYLKPETVELMCTNRLTPAQRMIPFLGTIPMWDGMGFGLGVSVVDRPDKLGFLGFGAAGAFGWPGAYGTWWQADPANDLVLIFLIQNSVPLDPAALSNLATGQRMAARAVLPMFQRMAYDAMT